MEKSSLDEALEICIEAISNSNINTIDKLELIINLSKFLSEYDESIKVLQKEKNRRIYERK